MQTKKASSRRQQAVAILTQADFVREEKRKASTRSQKIINGTESSGTCKRKNRI
jgi:hypothetical protein